MSCNIKQYLPRVNIATYDDTLYNLAENRWIWSGQMYWSIQCLIDDHISVSNRLPAYLPKEQFIPLNKSPSDSWDFCVSNGVCKPDTSHFLLIFTFKPDSTDFNDYIKFVFTEDGLLHDQPEHGLTDSAGKTIRLSITHITTSRRYNITEVWISQDEYQMHLNEQPLIVSRPSSTPTPTPATSPNVPNPATSPNVRETFSVISNEFSMDYTLLVIIILIIICIYIITYYFKKE